MMRLLLFFASSCKTDRDSLFYVFSCNFFFSLDVSASLRLVKFKKKKRLFWR